MTLRPVYWIAAAAFLLAICVGLISPGFIIVNDDRLIQQMRKASLQGDHETVDALFTSLDVQSSHFKTGLVLQGESQASLGNSAVALQFLQRGAKLEPRSDIDVWNRISELALSSGKLDTALEACRTTLSHQPGDVVALRRAAFVLGVSGARWDSARYYAQLLQQGTITLKELAIYADVERPIDASELFEQSTVTASRDRLQQLGLLTRCHTEGDPETESSLEKFLTRHPGNITALALLGEWKSRAEADEFADWYQNLPDQASDSPAIWNVLGGWLRAEGEFEAAAFCYWRSLQQNPVYRESALELGQVLAVLQHPGADGFLRQAATQFELAEQLDVILGSNGTNEAAMKQVTEMLTSSGRYWEAAGWAVLSRQMFPSREWPEESRQQIVSAVTPGTPRVAVTHDASAKIDLSMWGNVTEAIARAGKRRRRQKSKDRLSPNPEFREDERGPDFAYVNGSLPQESGPRMFEITGGGIGVVDFDLDEWPDLLFPQGGHWPAGLNVPPKRFDLPDELHRNLRGSGFVSATEAGLTPGGFGQGCAVGDFDNDGFPDLLIANVGPNQLYRNQGDGTFLDVTDESGMVYSDWTTSCVLADLNRDGNPDIYGVNYVTAEDVYTRVCQQHSCSPRVFDGAPDRLHRNLGNGLFEDVSRDLPDTEANGLGVVVAGIGDHDALDIFVSNDQVANSFLHNHSHPNDKEIRLRSSGLASGLAFSDDGLAMACMGTAAGDINQDGRLDLFVTNFREEPNTLYLQDVDRLFVDGTRQAGLRAAGIPFVGWGTQFLDANNNGRLDLVLANGHVDQHSDEDGGFAMPPLLFANSGDLKFEQIPAQVAGPFFEDQLVGRSLCRLDWNRDGKPDFAVATLYSNARLITNTSVQTGNWLDIRLSGVVSARDAIGGRVEVTTESYAQVHQLTAGDGYMASNERKLHFGLGDEHSDCDVTVTWPSGTQTRIRNASPNTSWVVVENVGGFQMDSVESKNQHHIIP